MDPHPIGQSGLAVTPIGFGAFKIGRNEQIKYPNGYALPTDDEVDDLIRGVLDLGINYFDTAPAYGTSEARLGAALRGNDEAVISTKVGEVFEGGVSRFDFSRSGVLASVRRSAELLNRDTLDLVFVHSDGNDLHVQHETDVVATLNQLKESGDVRAIGFSGKTVAGALSALQWADVIMVEYHRDDSTHADVIAEAHTRGVGVAVKKGLGSGHLPPRQAIEFVLGNPFVGSMVVGSLNLDHLRENVTMADSIRPAV